MKMPMFFRGKNQLSAEDKYFTASQWQLMWRKLKKNKMAIVASCILALFYIVAIFCEFFATQSVTTYNISNAFHPPQKIHFFDEGGFNLRPFVYGISVEIDQQTLFRTYVEDKTKKYPIYFFIQGEEYDLWNIITSNVHLFGVRDGKIHLFGTDKMGRDVFSRDIYASRISLSIGLVGVFTSFVLGCILGGISGYSSGVVDTIIQRVIEFLISIPTIPLWMALSAALPANWPPIRVYFGITIILSIFGWCGIARVVRGKLLEMREEDFVLAAKIAGCREGSIIVRHLLPNFISYLIVSLTLSIPSMILGETALSFLGIGIRPPAVSWGAMMQDAQNVSTILLHPWLLLPGLSVVIVVLAFNFLGDGLRDAADPYK